MKMLMIYVKVLALGFYLPLLRPALPRPRLPRLLHATLLPPPRGILRPLSRPLLVAPFILLRLPPLTRTLRVHAVPRTPVIQHSCLHLVPAQPGYSTLFPRIISVYRTILAVGLDGI